MNEEKKVLIKGYDLGRVTAVRAVRNLSGLGLREATNLVDSLPQTINVRFFDDKAKNMLRTSGIDFSVDEGSVSSYTSDQFDIDCNDLQEALVQGYNKEHVFAIIADIRDKVRSSYFRREASIYLNAVSDTLNSVYS